MLHSVLVYVSLLGIRSLKKVALLIASASSMGLLLQIYYTGCFSINYSWLDTIARFNKTVSFLYIRYLIMVFGVVSIFV